MSTEKIGEVSPPCFDSGHDPPGMMVYVPGIYRHTCPSCGKVVEFTVPDGTC